MCMRALTRWTFWRMWKPDVDMFGVFLLSLPPYFYFNLSYIFAF